MVSAMPLLRFMAGVAAMVGTVDATGQPGSMAALSVDAAGNARLMRRSVPSVDDVDGPTVSVSAIMTGGETSGLVELQAGRQDTAESLATRIPPDVISLHLELATKKHHGTIDEFEDEEDRRLFGITGPPGLL